MRSSSVLDRFTGLTAERAIKSHPDGENLFRLFDPAFPMQITKSFSLKDVEQMCATLNAFGDTVGIDSVGDVEKRLPGLPWRVLPLMGS